jgi:hypothetical protein
VHDTELVVVGLCGLLLAIICYRAKLSAFAAVFAFLSIVILLMALWQAWNGR